MQVAKWGNSLGVRLPIALVQQLGISEGDELLVLPAARKAGSPVVKISREPSKVERLQAMRRHRAAMPVGFQFDREEANSR
jgi:antitoxin MazE